MRYLTGLATHTEHVVMHRRYSLNTCPECNADRERRFARNTPFRYGFVREYLSWVRPRLQAIRAGESGVLALKEESSAEVANLRV
jgi:hypothetical protein